MKDLHIVIENSMNTSKKQPIHPPQPTKEAIYPPGKDPWRSPVPLVLVYIIAPKSNPCLLGSGDRYRSLKYHVLYQFHPLNGHDTVDGSEIRRLPVDTVNIPLFAGFHTS